MSFAEHLKEMKKKGGVPHNCLNTLVQNQEQNLLNK